MRRTTRSQTKKQNKTKLNSITRKFNELSSNKRNKVNKEFAKLQKSFKDKKKSYGKKIS